MDSIAGHNRGPVMSSLALDLVELRRLAVGGAGALVEHLLRQVALNLIAPGVASQLGGA